MRCLVIVWMMEQEDQRLEQSSKDNLVSQPNILCDICDVNPVVWRCVSCTRWKLYCEECWNCAHRARKHHVNIYWTENEDYLWCQQHNEPCELYCREDNVVICTTCNTESHSSHVVTKIEFENIMESYEVKLRKIERTVSMLRNAAKDALRLCDEYPDRLHLPSNGYSKIGNAEKVIRKPFIEYHTQMSNKLIKREEIIINTLSNIDTISQIPEANYMFKANLDTLSQFVTVLPNQLINNENYHNPAINSSNHICDISRNQHPVAYASPTDDTLQVLRPAYSSILLSQLPSPTIKVSTPAAAAAVAKAYKSIYHSKHVKDMIVLKEITRIYYDELVFSDVERHSVETLRGSSVTQPHLDPNGHEKLLLLIGMGVHYRNVPNYVLLKLYFESTRGHKQESADKLKYYANVEKNPFARLLLAKAISVGSKLFPVNLESGTKMMNDEILRWLTAVTFEAKMRVVKKASRPPSEEDPDEAKVDMVAYTCGNPNCPHVHHRPASEKDVFNAGCNHTLHYHYSVGEENDSAGSTGNTSNDKAVSPSTVYATPSTASTATSTSSSKPRSLRINIPPRSNLDIHDVDFSDTDTRVMYIYLAACCYQIGYQVEQCQRLGMRLFEVASKHDYAPAIFSLGVCYERGIGIRPNLETSIELYRRAAGMGYLDAMTMIGMHYYHGRFLPRDHAQAYIWFRKAADLGYPLAQHNVGLCFKYGIGIDKNINETKRFFILAADQYDSTAQRTLGACYEEGYLGEVDMKQAISWFRQSASSNDYYAFKQLADAFFFGGKGIPKDLEKSFQFYMIAGKTYLLPSATNNVGYCYTYGLGTTQDSEEGLAMFKSAAGHGSAEAMYNLAVCYANGLGVHANTVTALHWYEQAASCGYHAAFAYVGIFYENGFGCKQDISKAIEWYTRSMRHGNAYALYRLRVLGLWKE